MKVVINTCFGGFSLSREAHEELGLTWDGYGFDFHSCSKRSDPELVAVVEKLGSRANGSCAKLKVIEVPDDVEWEIEEYDGSEWVAEKHRTWE